VAAAEAYRFERRWVAAGELAKVRRRSCGAQAPDGRPAVRLRQGRRAQQLLETRSSNLRQRVRFPSSEGTQKRFGSCQRRQRILVPDVELEPPSDGGCRRRGSACSRHTDAFTQAGVTCWPHGQASTRLPGSSHTRDLGDDQALNIPDSESGRRRTGKHLKCVALNEHSHGVHFRSQGKRASRPCDGHRARQPTFESMEDP
jgi:hypothetical protein